MEHLVNIKLSYDQWNIWRLNQHVTARPDIVHPTNTFGTTLHTLIFYLLKL